MTSSDLLLKMVYCTEISPPLEIQEIFDFVRCEIPEEKESLELFYRTVLENEEKNWWKMDYANKKEIGQAIKKNNAEIRDLEDKRRAYGLNPFYKELLTEEIDMRVEKKKLLLSRQKYLKENPPNEERDAAKLVPINSFLDFNSAGFALCVFHKERTGSLKYYPSDNHVWCFSCTRRADSIDCMMAKEQIDFNSAVKRLLNQ